MHITVLDDLICYQAGKAPDKTAILYQDQVISYATFHEKVSEAARMLQGLGTKPGERIGLMFPNRPEMLFLYFACFRLGLVVVPVNTRYQRNEIKYALDHSECRLLLVDQQFYSKVDKLNKGIPSLARILVLDDKENQHEDNLHVQLTKAPDTLQAPEVQPETPAVIFYTSGSTSRPKGVTHTHFSLLANAGIQVATRHITEKTIWLVSTGVGYVAGLSGVTMPAFLAGCTLVLVPELQADNLLRAIDRHHVDTTLVLPTMLLEMLESPLSGILNLSSLRNCFVAGDECSHDLYRRFKKQMGHDLLQAFGMTECEGYLSNRPGLNKNHTIGKPAQSIQLRLVDPDGNDTAAGKAGEILVRGDSVMQGYWEDPVNTDDTLRDGWLYTGDVATCDNAGFYTFRERKREIIIHGGSNVGPHEVEDVIDSHPQVKESCVVGVPDQHYGAVLVAYIELEPGADQRVRLTDLQQWTGRHLAAYKTPDYWYKIEQLPKTATGKMNRKMLHLKAKADIEKSAQGNKNPGRRG